MREEKFRLVRTDHMETGGGTGTTEYGKASQSPCLMGIAYTHRSLTLNTGQDERTNESAFQKNAQQGERGGGGNCSWNVSSVTPSKKKGKKEKERVAFYEDVKRKSFCCCNFLGYVCPCDLFSAPSAEK